MIFMGLPSGIANGTNRVALLAQNIVAVTKFRSSGVLSGSYSIYLGLITLLGTIIGDLLAVDIPERLFNRILSIVMIPVMLLIILDPVKRHKD